MTEDASNLVDAESQVKQTTARKHPKEVSLMAELLNIYTNGFNLVGSWERTEDNDLQYAWLQVIARSLHSIRSTILLILSGYYGPALALLRTVTEDWLIAKDCQHHKPTLEALLYEKHRLGSKKFKLGYKDMADRIAKVDKVADVTYESDYDFQCKFNHTRRLSLAIMINRKTNELKVRPEYDEILFYACCESLMRNGLKMNELMYLLLESLSDQAPKTWGSMVEPVVKDIAEWLRDLHKKYGDEDTDVA